MMCRHLGMMANQGITWCELKRSEFPQCEQCSKFEKQPSYTTTTSAPTYGDNLIGLLLSNDIIKGVPYLTTKELQELENKLHNITKKHYRVILDYENFGNNSSYYTLRAEENEEPEIDYNEWDNYTR